MKLKWISLPALGVVAVAVTGCQQEVDAFCRSYRLADIQFTRKTINAMPERDLRLYARLVDGAKALCRGHAGW